MKAAMAAVTEATEATVGMATAAVTEATAGMATAAVTEVTTVSEVMAAKATTMTTMTKTTIPSDERDERNESAQSSVCAGFFAVDCVEEVTSTMDVLWERFENGTAHEGSCVCAARQSAGRGSRDHVWESPEGGVYVSALLKVNPSVDPQALTRVVACATRAAVVESTGGEGKLGCMACCIAEPNDIVFCRPKTPQVLPVKVAGLLVHVRGEMACVGVGINVLQAPGQPTLSARTHKYAAGYVTHANPFAFAGKSVTDACRQVAAIFLRNLAERYGNYTLNDLAQVDREYTSALY